MSDKQRKHDIKDFVGFAYYQPQDDIKIPYALFIFHTENGWKMKTCSFDRVAVRKKPQSVSESDTCGKEMIVKGGDKN